MFVVQTQEIIKSRKEQNMLGESGYIDGHNVFEEIISLENIFSAWREFLRGKKHREDVAIFARYVDDSLITLQQKLKNNLWQH